MILKERVDFFSHLYYIKIMKGFVMKKFNFTSHEEVPGWVRDYMDTVAAKPFFLLPIEEVNQFLNELDEFESSRPAYKMAS